MDKTFHLGATLKQKIDERLTPLLAQTVSAVAAQTAANWQQAVYQGTMWSGEKDAYAKSIKVTRIDDLHAVVSSNYKFASDIETGRPAYDLKRMLDTSTKVRRTEGGKRFLVIPMRHNTPGNTAHAKAMPDGVYELVKAINSSRALWRTRRPSGEVTHLSIGAMTPAKKQTPFLSNIATGSHMTVKRLHYQWGDRLTAKMLKEAGFNPGTHRNLIGMHRFDKSAGGSRSSEYLTFRVMMEGSKGWVIPARPGQHLVRGVVEDMRPKLAKAISQVLKG